MQKITKLNNVPVAVDVEVYKIASKLLKRYQLAFRKLAKR